MNPLNPTRRVFVKKTFAGAIATAIASQAFAENIMLNKVCSGVAATCKITNLEVADNNPYCAKAQNPGGNPPTQANPCVLFQDPDCAASKQGLWKSGNNVQVTVNGQTRSCVW